MEGPTITWYSRGEQQQAKHHPSSLWQRQVIPFHSCRKRTWMSLVAKMVDPGLHVAYPSGHPAYSGCPLRTDSISLNTGRGMPGKRNSVLCERSRSFGGVGKCFDLSKHTIIALQCSCSAVRMNVIVCHPNHQRPPSPPLLPTGSAPTGLLDPTSSFSRRLMCTTYQGLSDRLHIPA